MFNSRKLRRHLSCEDVDVNRASKVKCPIFAVPRNTHHVQVCARSHTHARAHTHNSHTHPTHTRTHHTHTRARAHTHTHIYTHDMCVNEKCTHAPKAVEAVQRVATQIKVRDTAEVPEVMCRCDVSFRHVVPARSRWGIVNAPRARRPLPLVRAARVTIVSSTRVKTSAHKHNGVAVLTNAEQQQ
jgi:hypothetical protein